MRYPGWSSGGVEELHDLLPPPERAEWKAAPDQLAEAAQVGPDTEVLLGAAVGHPEAHDLIEHQQDPESPGSVPQGAKKSGIHRDHAGRSLHRLDQECGDLAGAALEHLHRGAAVVGRKQHQVGLAGAHHLVRRSVIASLEHGHAPAPGEGAGPAQRHHDGFGAGVGESHPLERSDPVHQVAREAKLGIGGPGEAGPLLHLAAYGVHHGGLAVAVNQNGVIAGEVQQAIPVQIHQLASLTPVEHGGIRLVEQRAAGIAAGEIAPRLLEEAGGGRRAEPVALFLDHCSSKPSFSTHTFIAKKSRIIIA